MDKEYRICKECKISEVCHRNLYPIKITESGSQISLNKEAKYYSWECGRFTCSEGKNEARTALGGGGLRDYSVIELDDMAKVVLAVRFGSRNKPTDIGEMRIVTQEGRIYSKLYGLYYRSGNL